MKSLKLLSIVIVSVFFFSFLGIARTETVPEIFGKHPVCELSAVVKVSEPGSNNVHLLAGDNENNGSVFLYPLNSGKLEPNQQKELSLGEEEISDIEAITTLDDNRILIFGSHSRNSKCQIKEKRQRFLQAKVLGDRLETINEVIQSPKIESQILFDNINANNNKILQAVRNAIDEAERAADLAKGDSTACQIANAFNAEGAVAIPNRDRASDIWVGLRSPLVSLENKNFALLMRMKDIDKYQFDEVALLDLEGRGIRELTLNGDFIWGIGGGPEDETDNFVLWRLPTESLKPNAIIKPKFFRDLPTSSEGMVIVDTTTYVFIDGDAGSSSSKCEVPAKFIEFATLSN